MARLITILLLQSLILLALAREAGDIQAYSADLQSKLDRYRKDLSVLQQQAQQLKGQLELSKGKTALGLSQIQEGMANERDILNTIEGYLTLPFNVSRCECYDLTSAQRERALKEVQSIKQGLTNLDSTSQLSQSCPQYVEIRKELQRERRYIEGVEQSLSSTSCGQRPKKEVPTQEPSGMTDLAQSEYQTNLRAKGWCYGKLTQQQVKLLWFAYTVKNNVTNCPLETPYFDGSKCFACEAPTPYFDLSQRKCVAAESVDVNKQCVNPSSDATDNKPQPVQITGPTYKDVIVTPITAEPIIKSVTYNNQKKTVNKIVKPIQGKALVDKQKTLTNIKYVQVAPQETDPYATVTKTNTKYIQVDPTETNPEVKISRTRRTSSSSRTSNARSGQFSSSGQAREFQNQHLSSQI